MKISLNCWPALDVSTSNPQRLLSVTALKGTTVRVVLPELAVWLESPG